MVCSVSGSSARACSSASSRPGKRASRSSRRRESRFSRPSGRCQITPLSRSTRQWWVMVDLDWPCSSEPQARSWPAASARTTARRRGLPRALSRFSRRICSRSGWLASMNRPQDLRKQVAATRCALWKNAGCVTSCASRNPVDGAPLCHGSNAARR